uniref:Uncharacterized protein n=1 Tax=Anguilla anguilla TaxID=7936 RepID=A0A0E9UTV0_ANGAN
MDITRKLLAVNCCQMQTYLLVSITELQLSWN